LSEFAGAAACLSGAKIINPHNPSQIAAVLAEVLREGPNAEAWQHMREFVETNTATAWAQRFLARLEAVHREPQHPIARLRVSDAPVAALVRGARRPLVLLDYDGTISKHVPVPSQAAPTGQTRELLAELARVAVVYVLSGRSAGVLHRWLGDLPIGLVCEHGLAIKHPDERAWSEVVALDTEPLTELVAPMFRDFTERTPGSKIEYKAASIAWHYRAADPKLGAWRAKELRSLLENRLASQPYTVQAGARVIEVRHVQVSKGNAIARLLEQHPDTDLVVCAGDDRTDEEMFEAVLRSDRERQLVCRVGGGATAAPYMVPTTDELSVQLRQLARLWRDERAAAAD
jgi:trehalose 6-phosphate synthase/phosphatase